MTRTLFSFIQRMTRILTIEVDIEVNFEQGQNIHIFFLGNFFLGGGGGKFWFYCMTSYLLPFERIWT